MLFATLNLLLPRPPRGRLIAVAVLATFLIGIAGAFAIDDRTYHWTIGNMTVLGPRIVMSYWMWGRRVYAEQARLLTDCGFCFNDAPTAIKWVLDRFQGEVDRVTAELRADPMNRAARSQLAGLLLKLGRYDDAILEYRELLLLDPSDDASRFGMATAYLRAGDARTAMQLLRKVATAGDDVSVRWLMHLAQQAGGDGQPSAPFPFHPSLSQSAPVTFVDIARMAGVEKISANKAVAFGDFDGDGRIDIVTGGGFGPMSLFRNNGDGTFTDIAPGTVLGRMTDAFEVIPADYDNDGHLDLYITRGGPVKTAITTLLRNRGDGTFEDVTDVAGVRVSGVSTFTAAWADYNNDGHLDLYVATVATQPARGFGVPMFKAHRNQLFRNNGDGTFTEVGHQAGVDSPYSSYGATWGDYNGDGCPDLYVSTLMGPNHLYRNNCDGTFTDVARAAGVEMPWTAFVSFFWDYNNDGKLDIFSTNYALSEDVLRGLEKGSGPLELTGRLFRNNGNGTFTDVTRAAKIDQPWGSMGGNFGDLDGDGLLDFCLGNGGPDMHRMEPNACYRNNGDGTFSHVALNSGLLQLGKGHGIAFADLFDDGLLHMYRAIGGQWPGDLWPSSLLRPVGPRPSWITVKTRGVASNRDGIGATIRVKSGDLTQFREVGGGTGSGASTLRQWFGLGRRTRIDEIEVFWPKSRTRQLFRDVPINQIIEVTEFAPTYRVLPPRVAITRPLPTNPNPWQVRLVPDDALHRYGGSIRVEHVHVR